MLEFGSDFHFCTGFNSEENFFSEKKVSLYANGRHPILHLIQTYKWKRIWIPAYFCYDVIASIGTTGIDIKLYNDSPVADDVNIISRINFDPDDVLLRINYFGLRRWRDSSEIPVTVIEDHSHDLIGEWATESNADWVIASLRKTLPIPEGGILWSPSNLLLSKVPASSPDNELLFYKRLSGMLLKRAYLSGEKISKEEFRKLYTQTEEALEVLPVCEISEFCKGILRQFDILKWYEQKKKNWEILSNILSGKIEILMPEDLMYNYPFSLILKFASKRDRDTTKIKLINDSIYPAILWNIPEKHEGIDELADKMLSVHCDARYTFSEIEKMGSLLLKNIL